MCEHDPPRPEDRDERVSDRALERRVKRWLLTGPFECFVQCAPGLEEILAEEIRSHGLGSEIAAERGGVGIRLDHAEIMRANLSLRTASRVLLRLANFPAPTHEMLFDRAARIPWEVHLGTAEAYAVRIASRASRLQAGDAVANTLSGAITRRLRAVGLRPRRAGDAGLTFHVRLLDDLCTVSLDTSGEHLHRRGVRRHVHDAPVRETIAAALVLTGLGDHDAIVDPFCGSGTLLLETADVAAGRPPGRGRSFAFESAAWHRPGRWREARRVAVARSGTARRAPPRLIGMDVDPDALAAARHNLSGADHRHVQFVQGDATTIDLDALSTERGLLIGNLPYGVRLGTRAEAAALIVRFLNRCAEASTPWDLALLTTHPRLVTEHGAVHIETERTIESGGLRISMVVGRVRPA